MVETSITETTQRLCYSTLVSIWMDKTVPNLNRLSQTQSQGSEKVFQPPSKQMSPQQQALAGHKESAL